MEVGIKIGEVGHGCGGGVPVGDLMMAPREVGNDCTSLAQEVRSG